MHFQLTNILLKVVKHLQNKNLNIFTYFSTIFSCQNGSHEYGFYTPLSYAHKPSSIVCKDIIIYPIIFHISYKLLVLQSSINIRPGINLVKIIIYHCKINKAYYMWYTHNNMCLVLSVHNCFIIKMAVVCHEANLNIVQTISHYRYLRVPKDQI